MITTDSGEQVEALAPIIISASRSTDIPAFYGQVVLLIVWPRGIVFGIIRLIGGRCMCRLSGVRQSCFGQRTRSDITLFA